MTLFAAGLGLILLHGTTSQGENDLPYIVKDVATSQDEKAPIDHLIDGFRKLSERGLAEGKNCDQIAKWLHEINPMLKTDDIFRDMFPKVCLIADIEREIARQR